MRYVDRETEDHPRSLQAGQAGTRELDRLRLHIQDPDPEKKSFSYSAYKADDVRAALEALFHGKCAYCETAYAASQPVDIEHYRPKGAVAEDSDHGGYWWIAMAWDNLLPSCIDCNRKRGQIIAETSTSLEQLAANSKPLLVQSGKHDSFPLAGTGARAQAEEADFSGEHPLLLNPCIDNPPDFLAYRFNRAQPAGLIFPAGDEAARERGAVSVQVFGLNRLALVQDRTRLLRHLEFLGGLVIDLTGSIEDLEAPNMVALLAGSPAENVASRLRLLRDRTLAEIRSFAADESPYAAMATAWIEDFKARLAV